MQQDQRSHDVVAPLWPGVGLVWAWTHRQEEARPAASENLLYSSHYPTVSRPLTITESARHLGAFQEVLIIISTSITAEKSDITFFMLSVWWQMQSLFLNYCFWSLWSSPFFCVFELLLLKFIHWFISSVCNSLITTFTTHPSLFFFIHVPW